MPVLTLPLNDPPRGPKKPAKPVPRSYSSPILSQNKNPAASNDYLTLDEDYFHQTFYLPKSHKRGHTHEFARVPPITGFQVFVGVTAGHKRTSVLDWVFDIFDDDEDEWGGLSEGTTLGSHYEGNRLWFDIHFPEPVEITDAMLPSKYRIGVAGRDDDTGTVELPVTYGAGVVNISGTRILATDVNSGGELIPGQTYLFAFQNIPSILRVVDATSAYYSVQGGVNKLWYTAPNPAWLAALGCKAYSGEDTAVSDGGDVSLLFRILAATAEKGTDWLGNIYRSAVTTNIVTEIDTRANSPKFWLSKPNPSKFAVESLYFDVRNRTKAVVIDRIFLDPLTPDVYFNVYYSNDPVPGQDEPSWENLLWTHVPQTYKATQRATHVLPAPILAKYMKVEFSHLQARPYQPSLYQRPTIYKKHPKWVLDYFAARVQQATADPLIASRVRINYDAYDLAFNYYKDDLLQSPDGPVYTPNAQQFLAFLEQERQTAAGQVDPDTDLRIRLALKPYTEHPGLMGRVGDILGEYARGSAATDPSNYANEDLLRYESAVSDVSVLDRERVIFEKTFPVMFFYVTSRHSYRLSQALFEDQRAYFAGVKEIAFTRDHYSARYDGDVYIEIAGDGVNNERNDLFLTPEYTLITYGD